MQIAGGADFEKRQNVSQHTTMNEALWCYSNAPAPQTTTSKATILLNQHQ